MCRLLSTCWGKKSSRMGLPCAQMEESACNQETWVSSLCPERSPGGGSETSSILAWRKIPWTEEPGGSYSPWGGRESDPTQQLTLSLGKICSSTLPNSLPRGNQCKSAALLKNNTKQMCILEGRPRDLLWGSKGGRVL